MESVIRCRWTWLQNYGSSWSMPMNSMHKRCAYDRWCSRNTCYLDARLPLTAASLNNLNHATRGLPKARYALAHSSCNVLYTVLSFLYCTGYPTVGDRKKSNAQGNAQTFALVERARISGMTRTSGIRQRLRFTGGWRDKSTPISCRRRSATDHDQKTKPLGITMRRWQGTPESFTALFTSFVVLKNDMDRKRRSAT